MKKPLPKEGLAETDQGHLGAGELQRPAGLCWIRSICPPSAK
jgi:hypothetical protein